MAASVDNRQFGRLEPRNGLVSPVHAVGNTFGTHHRSNSPVRGWSFSPLVSLAPGKENGTRYYDDDDEDEDEEVADWKKLYGGRHLEVEPSVRDPRDEGTADSWIERNPSLIRLTGKHPLNCEPPLTRLMHYGFITPVSLHYVRNHGAVPKAEWRSWTLEITGLVKHPIRLTMDELVRDFSPVEIPVTLACAGNRRKEQNMTHQTIGFNWGPAAVSTTVWRGVRLRDVLRRCGAMGRKDGALFVCFEGAEDLPGGGGSKYGTSLRREVAMDPSRDVMLAYMQNGELLTPDHGFPVRVIIPGFIGGRMVKWLKRIIVTPQESNSHYHHKDNRVLPSHVDAELANAEGGGRKVTRVEVTLNGGETWLLCALDHPEMPNKYGKYWCWCFWSLEVEVLDVLSAKEVAVRAWDESLNTQPEKLIWNVMAEERSDGDAGDDEQLLVQGEGERLPPAQGRDRAGVRAPDATWEPVRRVDGPAEAPRDVGGPDPEEEHLHSLHEHLQQAVHNVGSAQARVARCKLVSKKTISHDVRLFKFALPSADQVLGLPIGKHIFLCATIDGKLCMRPYTPTSSVDEVGHFELLIKIYFKGENPKFPNGGLMSQHLESLTLGSTLDIKGPVGHIVYNGRGNFVVNGKPRFAKRLAMISGGTGITPVYQVIQAVLRDPEDRTEMHLVYANRSEDDILLWDELEGWARDHPEQFKVWYVINEAKRGEEWRYSTGFVTENILRDHIPTGGSDDTLALACGPPPMIQFAVVPNLEKMKYDTANSLMLFYALMASEELAWPFVAPNGHGRGDVGTACMSFTDDDDDDDDFLWMHRSCDL
ncbi:hypothetical protein GW17_00000495 [Ensete ventricosum]|nr:hypothetical protein GW17_00000495 [Ensete ventricosum]